MFNEVIGGFITNGLALLTDAGHMISDSISLGIALLAFTLGEKAANWVSIRKLHLSIRQGIF